MEICVIQLERSKGKFMRYRIWIDPQPKKTLAWVTCEGSGRYPDDRRMLRKSYVGEFKNVRGLVAAYVLGTVTDRIKGGWKVTKIDESIQALMGLSASPPTSKGPSIC